MAKSDWWFKFEYLKWLTDEQLIRCSLETQGFWIRCICMMRKSGTGLLEGTGQELIRMLGVSGAELKRCTSELMTTRAADVTVRHASVTQKSTIFRIVSRKIQRELKAKEQNRLRKRKQRSHADITPASRERVISKEKEVRKDIREETPQAATTKRGSRIPETFLLTPEMRSWASERRPDVDLITETEKFCNHFRSATGRTAVKLDWLLTWKNWILNSKGNGSNQKNNGSGPKSNVAALEQSAEYFESKYGPA